MATVNVYQQFFAAECVYDNVERRAASVLLIATSEEGHISYEVAVSFFPHVDDEDFAISYDAYFSKILYQSPGRRSKKREEHLMALLRDEANLLANEAQAKIFWDCPLRDARMG